MLLYNILSNILPGNWDQFISGLVATIIGTLLGIFGPFCIQSAHERKNKNRKAIQYLHELKVELKGLEGQFEAIKDSNIYLSPIKTPVWDSLINTNEIQLLSMLKCKKKSLKLIKPINQLFQIYNLIDEYNQWWNMYAQGAIVGARSKSELNSIKKFIDRSKEKLLCTDINNEEYEKSIKYTVSLIEEIEQLNSRKGEA